MNLFNQCNFTGRLVKDPELKTLKNKNKTAYCNFTMAVPRQLTKEQREDDDAIKADFPFFKAWGKTAEFICEYFEKGGIITLTASLETYKTDDDEYGQVFVVQQVQFPLANKSDDSGAKKNSKKSGSKKKVEDDYDDEEEEEEAPKKTNKKTNGNKKSKQVDTIEVDDEDIPF